MTLIIVQLMHTVIVTFLKGVKNMSCTRLLLELSINTNQLYPSTAPWITKTPPDQFMVTIRTNSVFKVTNYVRRGEKNILRCHSEFSPGVEM